MSAPDLAEAMRALSAAADTASEAALAYSAEARRLAACAGVYRDRSDIDTAGAAVGTLASSWLSLVVARDRVVLAVRAANTALDHARAAGEVTP